MKRKITIDTLTPGRCFAAVPESPAPSEGDAKAFSYGKAILSPEFVWRVIGPGDDGTVEAENARGVREHHAANSLVVEVPRQGYERLVSRVREEAASE